MTILAARLSARIERAARRRIQQPARIRHQFPNGRVEFIFQSGTLKHFFTIGHGMLSIADYFTRLENAWAVVMGGGFDGLLFRDWADNTATAANSSIIELAGGALQLARKYEFGGETYNHPISRPSNAAADPVVVLVDALGDPVAGSVDYTTGIVTTAGEPVGWTGRFDLPVAFEKDDWAAVFEAGNGVVPESLDLEEVIEDVEPE